MHNITSTDISMHNAYAADFEYSRKSDCGPTSVTFTAKSENAETWYWSFPGGDP